MTVWRWIVLLLLTGLTTGCAGPLVSTEPVTLDFAAPDPAQGYWRPLLDDFEEEHPHITINLQAAPDDETDVALLDAFSWFNAMQDDSLRDVGVFMESDTDFEAGDFPAGALALFQQDGKSWCIPFEADALVIYYNKDLFDRAGIPYPQPDWTWDDFLTAAQATRDPAAGTWGYLSPHSARPRLDALLFLMTHDADFLADAANPETASLQMDDPVVVEAVTFWADLMLRHNVAPTREQLAEEFGSGLDGELAAKQQGRVAMWVDWYGARDIVAGLLRDGHRWGIATFPADRRGGTYALGRGFCITTRAADPQTAWQLASFLSRQLPENGFPARRSVAVSESYIQREGEEDAAVAAASMENAVLLSPFMMMGFSAPVERLDYALGHIADGRATVIEALSPD